MLGTLRFVFYPLALFSGSSLELRTQRPGQAMSLAGRGLREHDLEASGGLALESWEGSTCPDHGVTCASDVCRNLPCSARLAPALGALQMAVLCRATVV